MAEEREEAYRPCKGEILPVKHHKEQQRNSRCAPWSRQKVADCAGPVDLVGCVASGSEGHGDNDADGNGEATDFT